MLDLSGLKYSHPFPGWMIKTTACLWNIDGIVRKNSPQKSWPMWIIREFPKDLSRYLSSKKREIRKKLTEQVKRTLVIPS